MINPTTITILPLISATIILIFGRRLGSKGSAMLSIANMLLVLLLTARTMYAININETVIYIKYGNWLNIGTFLVNWSFMFDMVTMLMIVIITFISTIVHIYSYDYMYEDPYNTRFFSYLSMFTFFMLVLVSADNFIVLFLGWEGVGICSYLLIGFWNTRILANKSAIKALIINKIGDACLIIGISMIFYYFKTVEYSTIYIMYPYLIKTNFIFLSFKFNLVNSVGLFLLIGCMAKSAQIGLHTWLPDAMEGPTPVSALIHAATMVTAGVFLIIRMSPIFEFMPNILTNMIFIGSLTTFLGATIGMLQNDIKKIIAYSTCSQLGYMILSCGVSNYSGGLFHLVNHAFFKALLFLTAGAVIHSFLDEQDIRKMGGLYNLVPFLYVTCLVGSLALAGFPFLAGFYSKDFIIESTLIHYSLGSSVGYWFSVISAFFTAYYSFRLIYLVFFYKNNSYKNIIKKFHEPSDLIYGCLLTLAILSIMSGYLLKDFVIGNGVTTLGSGIFNLPFNSNTLDVEYIPFFIKIIPVAVSLLGMLAVLFIYKYTYFSVISYKIKNKKYYTFFNNKWFFNNVYNMIIGKTLYINAYEIFFVVLEQGLFEPTPISNTVYKVSVETVKLSNGSIHKHALFVVINLTIFIGILIFYI